MNHDRILRRLVNTILWIAWIIIGSFIWCNIGEASEEVTQFRDKLWLQIVLTVAWLFITWMAWELKHAKEYPPDYNPPKRR